MRWIEGKKFYKKKERIGELERKSQNKFVLQVRFRYGILLCSYYDFCSKEKYGIWNFGGKDTKPWSVRQNNYPRSVE